MYETISYAIDGAIAVVRINRPDKLNAISPQVAGELKDLAATIRKDPKVRALIFTGNGRAFSAGADIAKLAQMESPAEFMDFIEEIQTTYNAIEDLPIPTIAAINGLAFGGGCELALACDFRIMAQDASIGVPEIRIGMLPGAGGTQRLTRLLPPAIAKQMICFGDPISSESASRYGLVNAVVPSREVLDTALQWGRRLAALPPLALRCAKLLTQAAMSADLKTGIESERQALAFLFSTEDRRIGMEAFLSKREPSFSGR